MPTETDGLISADHPYHNLPTTDEMLTCLGGRCNARPCILVMAPGSRLDLCPADYRLLAPHLDRNCRLVFVGQAGLEPKE